MKFLADMPISPKTVAFLRNLGHEALRVNECALDRAKDERNHKKLILKSHP